MPGALDGDQRRNQRTLERLPDAGELLGLEALGQGRRQLQRKVRALAREVLQRVCRHVRQRRRFGALARHVLFGERLVAQMFQRGVFERVRGARRVDQVARDHRVEAQPRERHAMTRQHDGRGLQVVSDLPRRLAFEKRLERREALVERHAVLEGIEQAAAGAPDRDEPRACAARSRSRSRRSSRASGWRRRSARAARSRRRPRQRGRDGSVPSLSPTTSYCLGMVAAVGANSINSVRNPSLENRS